MSLLTRRNSDRSTSCFISGEEYFIVRTTSPVTASPASWEMAWRRTVDLTDSIAGESIKAFLTVEDEGFDVNNGHDWDVAELMVQRGEATLPPVRVPAL